ncbi:hypothetical protein AK830_g9837 [Neonectria ditissima]|uniref:Maleylacetoacetate isomerase n=1 Tax=Neonectria ditissima TaxID=78410 RepID=A0A0P7B4W3_9HYPO|nr:hypothetical protein AK830_g9837 [Neonectria ditissima]
MSSQVPELTLYTYFRSSCSARVRTAAALKGISLKFIYVSLLKDEQKQTSYMSVNPSGTVPALLVHHPDGSTSLVRQSIAILEFFEEAFPHLPPLLPPLSQPLQRALVRDLVNILSIDIQPKTNLSVLKRLGTVGIPSRDWCEEQMVPGLAAFESILKTCAGEYCVGDSITLADVVLAPAVEAALRWKVDMSAFPVLKGVYHTFIDLPEVSQADWRHQKDTPES